MLLHILIFILFLNIVQYVDTIESRRSKSFRKKKLGLDFITFSISGSKRH